MFTTSVAGVASSSSPDLFDLAEHKIEKRQEYDVGSSPSINIFNKFGNITIQEGVDGKIVFYITITGKGKTNDIAKANAEAVQFVFAKGDDDITVITSFFKDFNCNNCSRTVDMLVIVPKKTKQILKNEFGDVRIDRSSEPFEAEVKFGKFYANELVTAKLDIEFGGTTLNKCKDLTFKSGFSTSNLGEIGSLVAKVEFDKLKIESVEQIDLSSEFTNIAIEKLGDYLVAKKLSYSPLKIKEVAKDFSKIDIKASFSKLNIAITEKHDFKAVLSTEFGSIKTGNVKFLEKTIVKKDIVVAMAGKDSNPKALVEISNSYGDIVFE
jgi:hypothetical protein